MLAIKVYNDQGKSYMLELSFGTRLALEELQSAFDRNLEQGLFSFPIDVPFTSNNIQFLNHAQNFNSLATIIEYYWRCDIIEDGIIVISDVKMKILSHKGRWDYGNGFFSINISGAKGMFGTMIKNKKLTDLNLGGVIEWGAVLDSREYAKEVMSGLHPTVANKLSFAPVVMQDFFDDNSENYAGELLNNSIVNNTILNVAYPNGWIFGKNATINTKVNKNTATYEEYRTIPYLKLIYVVKQIVIEHGYEVGGDFFKFPGFNSIHLFNNHAIEKYDFPFLFDVNTEINPSQHVPEILIVEFLVALQNTFNLKIDFLDNKLIEFNFNYPALANANIIDLTSKCLSVYSDATPSEASENGYMLSWGWDTADSYWSDKIKKASDLEVIATVTLYADIAALTFAFTLTEKHYILVTAENYFYNYVTSSGSWIPVFENNGEVKIGKGAEEIKPNMSPLCSFYSNNGGGVYSRKNMVATRQLGSYWNNGKSLVKNNFGLRIFYISTLTTGSFTGLPISFVHNYDADGNKLADISLCFQGRESLYEVFYKQWLQMLIESWIIKSKFQLDRIDLSNFKKSKLILVNGTHFMIKKQSYSLPLNTPTDLELVKM